MMALRLAALRGIGVCQFPIFVVADDLNSGRLVDLLPEWSPKAGILHAVFPSRRGLLPSVRALLDFLATEYAAISRAALPSSRVARAAALSYAAPVMSASLIGRLRSSAFRLSTTAVSMSLTGSHFSCLRGTLLRQETMPQTSAETEKPIRIHPDAFRELQTFGRTEVFFSAFVTTSPLASSP